MSLNSELSDREVEILRLVATGASNKEIARELHISTNTVKVHLRNIFAKIDVESRTEAALYAVKIGLVQQGLRTQQPDVDVLVDFPTENHAIENTELVPVLSSPKRLSRSQLIVIAVISILSLSVLILVLMNNPSGNIPREEVVVPTVPTRWTVLAPMPTPRYGFACVSYENKVYAIGGKTGEKILNVVELFDLQAEEWINVVSKPTPVSNISASVLRGKIYVPGGILASGGVTDRLEIYDIQRNLWVEGASLPIPLADYALSAHEGRLYLFGGWDGKSISNKVFEYIPETDQWFEKAQMSTPRMSAGAVSIGGKIILVGGTDGDEFLTLTEAYSPSLDDEEGDPWERLAPLPAGRAMFGISSLSGIVYVIGGNTENMTGSELLGYFPSSDQWQSLDSQILNSWSQLGMTGVESYLYIMGGNLDGNVTDQSLSYRAIYTVLFPVIK